MNKIQRTVFFICLLTGIACGNSGGSETGAGDAGNPSPASVPAGTAQVARSVTVTGVGNMTSTFTGVTTDSNGDVIAVGHQNATSTYNYGSGITAVGAYGGGTNVVVVKYNASGVAQW